MDYNIVHIHLPTLKSWVKRSNLMQILLIVDRRRSQEWTQRVHLVKSLLAKFLVLLSCNVFFSVLLFLKMCACVTCLCLLRDALLVYFAVILFMLALCCQIIGPKIQVDEFRWICNIFSHSLSPAFCQAIFRASMTPDKFWWTKLDQREKKNIRMSIKWLFEHSANIYTNILQIRSTQSSSGGALPFLILRP